MKWPVFREILGWTLFATVTAVYLLSRWELQVCAKRLQLAQTQLLATADLRLVETIVSLTHINASSDGPLDAVGDVPTPHLDAVEIALPINATGAKQAEAPLSFARAHMCEKMSCGCTPTHANP